MFSISNVLEWLPSLKEAIVCGMEKIVFTRAQERQNELKLRHQTEVGGQGIGGQLLINCFLNRSESPPSTCIPNLPTKKKYRARKARMSANFDSRRKLVDGELVDSLVMCLLPLRKALIHPGLSQSANQEEQHRPQEGQKKLPQTSTLDRKLKALITPGLLNLSTKKEHRPQARQNDCNFDTRQKFVDGELVDRSWLMLLRKPSYHLVSSSCQQGRDTGLRRDRTTSNFDTRQKLVDGELTEVGGRGVGGPFLVNVAQTALIPPGLIKQSTGKGHRPQTRQNDLKLRHQTEVAREVGGPFFVNCAQKALISPGLIKLSTGKGHRPQTRQNDLKL
ncbi:hypothetical protein B0H16DRAFT_1480516 [Mycena metata]|uniref:Uncharacterized protein n=1 Tax=Mycena metata TaxID=1033252 RepID=A0AAD7MDG8_9AGAR|nr:hypothetical protein B0H16DRAFT_1480516 [Mycena metata]